MLFLTAVTLVCFIGLLVVSRKINGDSILWHRGRTLDDRLYSDESALQGYSTNNPGGLQFAGAVLGVVGLFLAALSTAVAFFVWFKIDFQGKDYVSLADFFENRFIRGLLILIIGNALGIITIAAGKFYHSLRNIMFQLAETREQNNTIAKHLARLVELEEAKTVTSRQVREQSSLYGPGDQ